MRPTVGFQFRPTTTTANRPAGHRSGGFTLRQRFLPAFLMNLQPYTLGCVWDDQCLSSDFSSGHKMTHSFLLRLFIKCRPSSHFGCPTKIYSIKGKKLHSVRAHNFVEFDKLKANGGGYVIFWLNLPFFRRLRLIRLN